VPFVKLLEELLEPVPVAMVRKTMTTAVPLSRRTVILMVPQERSPRVSSMVREDAPCSDGEELQRGEMASPRI